MIIEFIGSTAAGKTTLISGVQRSLASTVKVTTSYDLIATPMGLQGVTQPTAKNLIQEFIGLPFFIGSLHRHRAFVVFALKMLARQANFTIFTLNNLRSLVRKIGVYEKIRRDKQNRFILVDEGTVLLAHNIFVYSKASYTYEEIAMFANLIPLPDVIVYVRSPVDSLIKRSLQRTDPPRELKSKNRASIKKYVNRAVTMFEQLIKNQTIRSRVLVVENPEILYKRNNPAVDYVTEALLNYKTAEKQV
jgi:deoxyadenosine/deoxycytidine kinase